MIDIRNLSFSFRNNSDYLEVLNKISLKIDENEFVSVLGPSGCGKTTLLRLLGDLINTQNTDLIDGEILLAEELPSEARLKHNIGFAFQDPVLLPWRNVIGNINIPKEVIKDKGGKYWDADELLRIVGLSEFSNSYPQNLSGGMKQRVSIARALIYQPSILLMDEPFGALDASTREELNIELLKIWDNTSATIVFVTHSIPEAVFLSDRVITLSSRPASIQHELEIDLPRPRDIKVKETTEFMEYSKILRSALEDARMNE